MNKSLVPLQAFTVKQGSFKIHGESITCFPDSEGLIRLRLDGNSGRFSGIDWSRFRYFIVDMLADMDSQTLVNVSFEKTSPLPNEAPGTMLYEMVPTRRVKLVVDLDDLKSDHYFMLTLPGMFKGRIRCNPSHIGQMNAVELLVRPGYSHVFKSFTIYEAFVCDKLPDLRIIGEPMVDILGQWNSKEWNTKTSGVREMTDYLHEEYARAKTDNSFPADWTRFGGWSKLKFDKTGYFHTHHDGKRWWLVDPDGYAFFSNGMCYGSRMGVHGFTDKMENLFSWLPDPDDQAYHDAWTTADQIAEFVKRNGAEAGKNRKMFNFPRANMIRAFGKDNWWEAWLTINTARLKRWGFNTIGVGVDNYNDERVTEFLDKARIPFVWTLKNFPLTDDLIFRDFPDVFSKQYEERSKAFAETQLSPFTGNPHMIGYFINNEPEWKFQVSVNLAERVFAHPQRLASKQALIKLLIRKYGNIKELNAAWHTDFFSFEDLYTPFEQADRLSSHAAEDMTCLRAKLLEKYAQVPNGALRRVDPDHMNLGLRYSRISEREIAGSESFDILSFNCYFPSPLDSLQIASQAIDMPRMIGEWHIGGADKGLLSCGLLASATQEERGIACEYYMQTAMAHKNCVGIHYFEMNDQPLLGRFDGECMQHGVIDVCNRSYDDFVAHLQSTNRKMYELASGTLQPTEKKAIVFRAK